MAADDRAASLPVERPQVLISACLLGERVRYDGEVRPDPFVLETLGPHVEWLRVCPESDSGMPTPRPPMDRVGSPRAPRLVSRTGDDLTDQLLRFVRRKLGALESEEICGYVCKARSPSSGMVGVDLHSRDGKVRQHGAGLFTGAFMQRFPQIPVEQNDRLADPALLASFAERVFARRRWLDMEAGGLDRSRLVDFHTDHKFQLLAHGRQAYSELGWLVGVAGQLPVERLFSAYELAFMAALSAPAPRAQTTDALMHMLGFLKRHLPRPDKLELLEAIGEYRKGRASLARPLNALRRHAEDFGIAYLTRQSLLAPYPAALMRCQQEPVAH